MPDTRRDSTGSGPPWTEEDLRNRLRGAGATDVERVRFRGNRSTIWSVTSGGTVLNLHEGYRTAPWSLLRHFVTLAIPADRSATETGLARSAVRTWHGLAPAIARARRRPRRRRALPARREVIPGPCCGNPEQIRRLRALFHRLNRERFQVALPPDLHLRLSARMRSRLGHMRGHVRQGRRIVVEIALNDILLRDGNSPALTDTLLHEMAHAADWLIQGGRGHGPTWKAWALRVGCEPRACTHAEIVQHG